MSRNTGYQPIAPYVSSADLPPVTFDNAMAVSAVWQAVRIQSENIASLPLKFYKNENGKRVEDTSTDIAKLLANGKINRYQDKVSFLETLIVNLVSWGNAYCLIQRNASGGLIGLLPLAADQMEVELRPNGDVVYHFTDSQGIKTYRAKDIWHVKLFGNGIEGLSPMGYARQTLGIASAANKRTGKVIGNAGKRTGVFSVDTAAMADGDLSKEQKDGIRREYGALAQGDEDFLPVLPVGLKFEPLSLTPADQELLANRKYSVVEVARIFNVPPILLHSMDDTTTLGSSTSEIINSYYKLSLRPLLIKLEESLRINFMTPTERSRIFAHFNLDDLFVNGHLN
ncbi:phage portal protein [Salinisphaera sp. LB1]|uniref:phage portal protein n=1 Tax=Salinisphaera sp. LB1 TaxID=2183911 RepID=UPI001314BE0F|nr:phage portal protein [Salinisphaera sp. LB1]